MGIKIITTSGGGAITSTKVKETIFLASQEKSPHYINIVKWDKL
jgi:hypothetical protein